MYEILLQVSVTLFFLPIIVMSIAYALIIWRLWGTKPPGEKVDTALTNAARAKRKVSYQSVMLGRGIKKKKIIDFFFLICYILTTFLYSQTSTNSTLLHSTEIE